MTGNDNRPQLLKGVVLAIATVFIGSTVAATGKHVADMVPVSTIVMAQYSLCLLLALPWVLRHGRRSLATNMPWQHAIRGISGCLCFYAYYLALKYIPLVDAALLRNTAPLLVPLVITVWFRHSIPLRHWPPLLIGFTGILLVLRPSLAGINLWHLVGLASGLGLAISMVSTRLLGRTEPESRILFYYFSLSLLFVLPFFVFNYQPIPLRALPWLLYIGVAMYYTFVLYTRAYNFVPAALLAPTSYFAVVFSGLLDWVIWEHVPDTMTVFGTVLVAVGGILVLRSRQPVNAADP